MNGAGARLRVSGLNAAYGQAHILTDVALEVGAGEVAALLGRNGAGKSTTFRAILGLIVNRSGAVVFDGEDVSDLPTYDIVRRGLGYVPEDRRIFTELTVEENLEVGRQPPRSDAPRWTPEKIYALFPNLAEMRRRAGGAMSGGEQQMLTIARALMMKPDLLILDEPTLGLAPVVMEQISKALERLRQTTDITVLLGEQNVTFALPHADRVYVLEHGRIVWEGDPSRFAAEAGAMYL